MADEFPSTGDQTDDQQPEIVDDSPSAVDPAEPLLPFVTLGHFQVLSRLGSGGMGDVYLGFEPALERTVAIKVLPADVARQSGFVKRFKAEAAAAARLVHPHVVQIYFIGEDAGHHFFAMQHVEGESLAVVLKRRQRLEIGEALHVIEQVLEGLAAAHELGLVHRDIKPGNILLDHRNQRALLADFGLVKALDGSQTMGTTGGTVLGTAEYLSPEQGEGDEIDARSDLYSTGVMLYYLLAGELPFQGKSMAALIYKHVHTAPPQLSERAPGLPRKLTTIVDRLLAKHPDERFQTADELREALQQIPGERRWPAGGNASGSLPPARAGRGTTRGRHRTSTYGPRRTLRWPVPAAILAIGIIAAGVAWTMIPPPEPEPSRSGAPSVGENAGENRENQDRQTPVGAAAGLSVAWKLPEGARRFAGHDSTVGYLAISPDGTRLLSGDVNGLILVRDLETDQIVARIDGIEPRAPLRRASFTTDGTALLTCWGDNVIRMFDAGSGSLLRSFHGHAATVNAARQIPGRRQIISGGMDVSIRVWNMDTGEELLKFGAAKNAVNLPPVPTQEDFRKLDGHIVWIRDVVPLADGKHAISAGNDTILFLWNIDSGLLMDRLVAHSGNVFNLFLSPDGERLFSEADDRRIRLWSIPERKAIQGWAFQDKRMPPLAFAARAQAGAIGTEDGVIRLRDLTQTETILETLPVGPGSATALAFTADDAWLIAGYIEGSIVAWPVGAALGK